MATGAARRGGRASSASRNVIRQPQGVGDGEVDAFPDDELARPEVRTFNKYALHRAYVRIGLKGIGALALLWATVVLLGGFVSVLSKTDFWNLTIIAFLQAAGLSDALGDDRFMFFEKWVFFSLVNNIISKGNHKQKLKGPERKSFSVITDHVMFVVFFPVAYFAFYAPIICICQSGSRLSKQDYGADGDASQANLKRALNLYYSVSLVHGAISFLLFLIETIVNDKLVDFVSKQHGFSPAILEDYFHETRRMCISNPASTGTWNLMTYGAGLLDSELPEDYATGVRVVGMLIELHDTQIRRVLIRSPKRRIEKLIGALVWRSPVEEETRWLAARIVEHIAGDLNLAQFPGASECLSSLLDTSYHNNGAHEAIQLLIGPGKARRKSFLDVFLETMEFIIKYITTWKFLASGNGGREDNKTQEEHVDSNAKKGRPDFARPKNTVITNGDLILQGLRILENLAHDQHNCTVIYNTKGLISKIVAPVSSNSLTQDIDTNGAWIQVVDASLKVVSRLMRAPGDTGRDMRSQITDSSNAVRNLEAILDLQSSRSCILELQMRAIEVFAQLFTHGSASLGGNRKEDFIERGLNILCSVKWMECYLAQEKMIKIDKETWTDKDFDKVIRRARPKNKMKLLEDKMKSLEDKKMEEAKETAIRLKEKAGEALATLSMGSQRNSEAIKCFTDVVHHLTEMLDSKTIKCKISETETLETEMKIGCRISAAIILKNLCPHFTKTDDDYVKKTTLKKVLAKLLHITAESPAQESSSTSTLRWREHFIVIRINCTEDPRDVDTDEQHPAVQSHMQHSEERRLQAVLLSLCADICAKYSIKAPDLATMVVSREDFTGKLKNMVEENSHAMPACLATLKLTCQMVIELISDDQTGEAMETKKTITGMLSQVVAKLSEASKMMAGVESATLFAGTNVDCYGVPTKPLLSVLVKQAEELLERRKDELDMINTPTEGQ